VPYTNKLQPVGIGGFARLYPGVDGMAANGLRYGASVEIRQNLHSANNYSVSLTGTSSSAIPTGANTIGTSAASPSGSSSAQTLFVRRAFTYLAGDQWGLLRFGTTDGVLGLFDNGQFTSQTFDYGVGQLNGGAVEQQLPGNTAGTWVWLSQAGAEYDNAKIVYLTPQFFGFDFGVQYSPQMGNADTDSVAGSPLQAAPCSSAVAVPATGVSGCQLQSSGAVDGSRWLNQVAVGARYQGSFGPITGKAYVMYETAGKTDFTGPQPVAGTAASLAANVNRKFDNLSFISTGALLSFDTIGLSFSADYIGGAINNQLSMRPSGGASMSAPIVGFKYTPPAMSALTIGASVATATFQGANQLVGVSQRRANYLAVGGYYVIAPGMAIVGEYEYLTQHQGDFNLALGTVGGKAYNDIKGQGFLIATVVNW
jgi:predicted porin